MFRKWKAIGIAACTLVAMYSIAYAKEEPALEDPAAEWGSFAEPFAVRNPLNFSALYGYLGDGQDVDVFEYSFSEGTRDFYVNITIPACEDGSFDAFYPSVAVIGPGWETTDGIELPFELGDGEGARLIPNDDQERLFYDGDPFGFYSNYPYMFESLEAGTYLIAVWNANEQTGPYVLRTGSSHPTFEDYTSEDWDAVNEMYSIINDGGWIGNEC